MLVHAQLLAVFLYNQKAATALLFKKFSALHLYHVGMLNILTSLKPDDLTLPDIAGTLLSIPFVDFHNMQSTVIKSLSRLVSGNLACLMHFLDFLAYVQFC